MRYLIFLIILFSALAILAALAQGPPPRGGPGGPPPMRHHEANEARPLEIIPADARPPASPVVSIELRGSKRRIQSNGMPSHKIGTYPARHNPNRIGEQRYDVSIDATPKTASRITTVDRHDQHGPPNMPFGFAVNGIFFEPGTAEFWHGDRESGWNYEALGGAVPLSIDENFAHVQPNGAYHYHGMPTGLLAKLGLTADAHSPLVGWAADGFPIYALYGHEDPKDPSSRVVEMRSSFRLRNGDRPGRSRGPGGTYDGAFTKDYEYVEGSGTLDECNGRFTVTPEYPEGTYAYFLTSEWPVIPRAFRGTPINLKMQGPRPRR